MTIQTQTSWCDEHPFLSFWLGLALVVASICAFAFAFCYTWAVFAVPLGLPVIGWLHAWGLRMLVTLLHRPHDSIADEAIKNTWTSGKRTARGLRGLAAHTLGYLFAALCVYIALAWFGPVAT